jgi:hypothetical protein
MPVNAQGYEKYVAQILPTENVGNLKKKHAYVPL